MAFNPKLSISRSRGCPQRKADCPGVLDYAGAPPCALDHLPESAFQVRDTPPDFSDHQLTTLAICLPPCGEDSHQNATLFKHDRLRALNLPTSIEMWQTGIEDIAASNDWTSLIEDLQNSLGYPLPQRCDAQLFIDDAITRLTTIIYTAFGKHHLVKRRSSLTRAPSPTDARHAAPQHLQDIRTQATKAKNIILTRWGITCRAPTLQTQNADGIL